MKTTMNKYNILDRVYHVTPDSAVGVIIDIQYTFSTCQYLYLVSFSTEESVWCMEHELQLNKSFA